MSNVLNKIGGGFKFIYKPFKTKASKDAYTPKGALSWSTKLAAEFLGTIFMTWMIGILGVTFDGTKLEILLSNGLHATPEFASHLVIGFWVALDIFLVLAVFSRWSCDLNPAVTTYRLIDGQNSFKYAFAKIAVQMLGGLVAGLCIWSTQQISFVVSGAAFDDPTSFHNTWSAFTATESVGDKMFAPSTTGRHLMACLGEFMGVFILLWPIMTKQIKSPVVKDMVLILIVGFGVAALIELGTVGWNPARSFGTNYIYDAVKGGSAGMQLYWAYAVGPILASFALFYGQRITELLNKTWEGWLAHGKVHDIFQHTDEGKMDRIDRRAQRLAKKQALKGKK